MATVVKPRIAIVDDDKSVRKALARLLSGALFEVKAFESGRDLLASLDSFGPDCLVLDLQMPEMTGLDLQRHLARVAPDIPVIVITGHDSSSARSESLALGARDYLAKPIDGDLLISSILKSLGAGPREAI
jgi:FixJ family two-component response regulator